MSKELSTAIILVTWDTPRECFRAVQLGQDIFIERRCGFDKTGAPIWLLADSCFADNCRAIIRAVLEQIAVIPSRKAEGAESGRKAEGAESGQIRDKNQCLRPTARRAKWADFFRNMRSSEFDAFTASLATNITHHGAKVALEYYARHKYLGRIMRDGHTLYKVVRDLEGAV